MWTYILVSILFFWIVFFACALLSICKEEKAYKKGFKEGKQ
jgi:hypothetical protein